MSHFLILFRNDVIVELHNLAEDRSQKCQVMSCRLLEFQAIEARAARLIRI